MTKTFYAFEETQYNTTCYSYTCRIVNFFLSIIVKIYKKICKRTIVHKFDTLRKASVVEDVVTHKDLQKGDMIVHPGI